jgi:hypothetical protein
LELTFNTYTPEDGSDLAQDFYRWNRTTGAPKVSVLAQNQSLQIRGSWEFLPYNDSELAPRMSPKFADAVALRASALLNSENGRARKAAIAEIKDIFDTTFGSEARDRNIMKWTPTFGPLARRIKVEPARV